MATIIDPAVVDAYNAITSSWNAAVSANAAALAEMLEELHRMNERNAAAYREADERALSGSYTPPALEQYALPQPGSTPASSAQGEASMALLMAVEAFIGLCRQ